MSFTNVIAHRLVRDEGSVVLFEGLDDETGEIVTFAADHRPAQDIVVAIEAGDEPVCCVPSYQITGRRSA